jgi:uncharacterized protein (DUF433 family)
MTATLLLDTLSIPSPLRLAEGGRVLRVGETRVTLDTVVSAYRSGASAEEIASAYPSLGLADVYAVLAYYLQNEVEVASYLARREEEARNVRKTHEQRAPSHSLREQLLARQRRAA